MLNITRRVALLTLSAMTALTAPASAQEKMKVSVMYTAVTDFLGAYVAKDYGIFDKHNLDVTMVNVRNGSAITAGLVSNSAQIGGLTPTVHLQAVEGGLDLVMIGITKIYPTPTNTAILAYTGHTLKEPKDFVGKKVGVIGFNGFLHVALRKWLSEGGVDYEKVNYVEIGPAQMMDALRAKQVDAVTIGEPFYDRIIEQKIGYNVAFYTAKLPDGTFTTQYSVTRAWAKAHPKEIAAFRAAIDEANAFIKANEDKARASLAKYSGLDPAVVAGIPLPNLRQKIDKSQIQYWIDVSKEQKMLEKPMTAESQIWP